MKKTTLGSKILAVFIAVLILFGAMPLSQFGVSANSTPNTVADAATIADWTTWFSNNNNRYAGGVFMDKSVYEAEDVDGSYFDDIADKLVLGKDNFGNDNFLVSLSAIGSTTEIYGYSVTPTDTMLVLDVSGSMSASNTRAMVTSTNRAIETLQSLNLHNRVGVVLYSGNTNFGNSNTNTATVILPLGRYTTTVTETVSENGSDVTHDVFLEYNDGDVRVARTTGRYNSITAGVRAEGSSNYITTSKAVAGGTYIQNGLYQAYNQFPSGDDTVIEDGLIQEGTQRMPIIVLMSDGAPTAATPSYYNVGTSSIGDGSTTHATASVGFLTQLTASWVKANLKTKYNGTEPRFYTLGLGTSNNATATGVLNPSASSNNAASYWNNFLAGNTVYLTDPDDNSSFSVTKRASGDEGMARNYVNQYWSASNADGLNSAFSEIVNEIIIQSRYYSTLVNSGEHEKDGYISFTDEIGQCMEVKDIKGIHIGEGTLETGAAFAEFATTGNIASENLTAAEKAEINSNISLAIIDRFNVSATAKISPTQAQALYNNAVNNGFISYTNENEFSNYIAWYADKDNYYLAPYNADSAAPQNAKYIVKSYFFLDDVTLSHADSDMLYILVRVREEIETGRQIVDANLPAALLPQVTYTIKVSGNELTENNITSMTNDASSKAPVCLLYEVGVDSEITPYNIEEKIPANYKQHLKDTNGNYEFYTNRWYNIENGNKVAFAVPSASSVNPDIFNHGTIGTTVAHFIPSLQNERYYFVTDTPILTDKNTSSQYTGASAPADKNSGDTSGYYHAYQYVIDNGNGNYELVTVYNPITDNALNNAISKDGKWYIKAGTAKRYYAVEADDTHDPNGTHKHKTENYSADNTYAGATKTLPWSFWFNTVKHDHDGHSGYHVLSYLGNNGKVTVEPGEGIKLSKTISETVNGAGNTFTFKITLSNVNQSEFTYHNVTKGTTGKLTASSDVLTVLVEAGETIYIDIPAGATYTVEEQYNKDYIGVGTNSNGTVTEDVYADVKFVNNPRGFGSLVVEKDVTHPFTTLPSALAAKEFDFTVTFSGGTADDYNQIKIDGADNSGGQNEFTFKLKDGDDKLFTNIPEGITYTVVEDTANLPAGFTLDQYSGNEGKIEKDAQKLAHFVNKYDPSPATANIILTGTKTLDTWDTDAALTGAQFEIALQRVNLGGGENTNIGAPVTIGTLTKNSKTYSYNLSSLGNDYFNEIGSYTFGVYEVVPSQNKVSGVKYDTTFALFTVYVTDTNADGALEISSVEILENSAALGSTVINETSVQTITKNFTNLTGADTVSVPLKKVVKTGDVVHTQNKHNSGIMFGLFKDINNTNPDYFVITDNEGKGVIEFNVKSTDFTNEKPNLIYYVREIAPAVEDRLVGMTYDESWKYVVKVSWDSVNDKAFTNYYTYADYTDGDGLLTELAPSNLEIINTFEESSKTVNSISISGNKTLTAPAGSNRVLGANDKFYFDLYETNATFHTTGLTAIKTAQANQGNNWNISIENIKFDSEGTKYLVLKEQGTTIAGIKNDSAVHHITVDVVKATDANGKTILKVNNVIAHKLGATTNLTYDSDTGLISGADFVNVYEIKDEKTITVNGKKTLSGRDIIPGEFEFELYKVADGVADQLVTTTSSTDSSGTFSFALAYTENDLGTHKYYIKEKAPSGFFKDGVTYDQTLEYFVVEVEDNGDSKLKVSSYETDSAYANKVALNSADQLDFVNGYTAAKTSITFSGTKTLENKTLEDGMFTFELYEADSNFTVNNKIASVVNGEGALATDKYSVTLEYSQGEGKIYYYVLEEKIPDGDKEGISYDTREYHITVVVADNGKGNMTASYSIVCPGMESFNFTNQNLDFGNAYNTAPARFGISGKKDFNVALEADMFEFILTDNENNELQRVKNDAQGNFVFTDVELGVIGDNVFYVKEAIPDGADSNNIKDGIKYDAKTYKVVITTVDNGNGEIEIVNDGVKYYLENNNVSEILFTNKQAQPIKELFEITKVLKNAGTKNPEGFKFALVDANGNEIETVTTNAQGKAEIELEYDIDDIGKTYEYKLYEVKGDEADIVYDKALYEVSVKVGVNDEAELETEVEVNGTKAAKVTAKFENVVVSEKTVSFEIEKEVINSKDFNDYEFVLEDAEGNKKIVKTDKNGKAKFDLTYALKDADKTFEYKLYEVKGDNADMIYSVKVYDVEVKVSLNDEHELETEFTVNDNAAEKVVAKFTNVLVSEKTVSFEIEKTVKNEGTEKIGPENFEFVLEDANGKKETVKTDKKGNAKFDLTYALEDVGKTFEYKLYEVKGNNVKVTYSDKVYEIKVKVSLDDEFKLKTDLTVDGKEAIKVLSKFENIYDYSPKIPDTGDHTNLIFWVVLLFVSGGVTVALIVTSKNKKRKINE